MSRTVAIIQARMTSTRLPGKSLLPIGGRPMLARVVERVRAINGLDAIWIATTNDGSEAPLVALAAELGMPVYRGSVDDVLSRFAAIARKTVADVIMRITADCPLLDPAVSAQVLDLFRQSAPCDYASNTLRRSYPRGLDTEVFTARSLRDADAEATDPLDREHVTRFLYRQPDRYQLAGLVDPVDRSHLRWTVDTTEDFEFVTAVHDALRHRGLGYSLHDTLAVLQASPGLLAINAHVEQKRAT